VQSSFLVQFMYVGMGGFIGAGLRFATGSWLQKALPGALFPFGTMAVNVIGCLAIGFVAAYRQPLEPGLRLFLMVGLLGGFTTFSAFALETLTLTHQGQNLLAFTNVVLKLVLGLGAAALGFELGRMLAQ
jgi:CrcB protein